MSLEKCLIVGNKRVVARGGLGWWMTEKGGGTETAGYLLKGQWVFCAVIVYDPLHFMENSLPDLSFDANWRMRSSGAEAYGQEAPQ